MTYTDIKSEFVKEAVKNTPWKNREYIDRLIDIEKFATTGYCSTGAGYIRNSLKSKYPKEWEAIWLELNPKQHKEDLEYKKEEDARERKENLQFKNEEALELKQDKEAWKKMGGKL
jgi:hypothetical protein